MTRLVVALAAVVAALVALLVLSEVVSFGENVPSSYVLVGCVAVIVFAFGVLSSKKRDEETVRSIDEPQPDRLQRVIPAAPGSLHDRPHLDVTLDADEAAPADAIEVEVETETELEPVGLEAIELETDDVEVETEEAPTAEEVVEELTEAASTEAVSTEELSPEAVAKVSDMGEDTEGVEEAAAEVIELDIIELDHIELDHIELDDTALDDTEIDLVAIETDAIETEIPAIHINPAEVPADEVPADTELVEDDVVVAAAEAGTPEPVAQARPEPVVSATNSFVDPNELVLGADAHREEQLKPVVEVGDYTAAQLEASVRNAERSVVRMLIDHGRLTAEGPITDDDVAEMVLVAATSQDMLSILRRQAANAALASKGAQRRRSGTRPPRPPAPKPSELETV